MVFQTQIVTIGEKLKATDGIESVASCETLTRTECYKTYKLFNLSQTTKTK